MPLAICLCTTMAVVWLFSAALLFALLSRFLCLCRARSWCSCVSSDRSGPRGEHWKHTYVYLRSVAPANTDPSSSSQSSGHFCWRGSRPSAPMVLNAPTSSSAASHTKHRPCGRPRLLGMARVGWLVARRDGEDFTRTDGGYPVLAHATSSSSLPPPNDVPFRPNPFLEHDGGGSSRGGDD